MSIMKHSKASISSTADIAESLLDKSFGGDCAIEVPSRFIVRPSSKCFRWRWCHARRSSSREEGTEVGGDALAAVGGLSAAEGVECRLGPVFGVCASKPSEDSTRRIVEDLSSLFGVEKIDRDCRLLCTTGDLCSGGT